MFYLCVFFPPLLLSLLLLSALSDKRRQPAKQGCSGTNLSITADGTLTTCTLKIKLALKADAWQPSLWKWLQCSATEKAEREKNILRKQQCDGSRERESWKKGKTKVESKRNKKHGIDGGNLCYFPAFFNLVIFSEDLQAFPGMLLQVALDSSGLSNNLKVLISSATETRLLLTHTQSWPRPVSIFQMSWTLSEALKTISMQTFSMNLRTHIISQSHSIEGQNQKN